MGSANNSGSNSSSFHHTQSTAISSGSVSHQQQLYGQQPSLISHNSATFRDLVRNDMVAMLQQMYTEMNVTTQLSLDQLAEVNPALWDQMRIKAEDTASALLASRGVQISNRGPSNDPDLSIARKRPLDDAPPVQRRNEVTLVSQQQNRARISQQDSSRSHMQAPVRAAQDSIQHSSEFQPQQRLHWGAAEVAALSEPAAQTTPAVQSGLQQVQEHLYVNGFLCETPVVLDVDRLQVLGAQLAANYDGQAAPTSADFQAVAQRVARRLESYVKDIFTPPELPPLLFGA